MTLQRLLRGGVGLATIAVLALQTTQSTVASLVDTTSTPVGESPFALAIDSSANRLYVVNFAWDGTVRIIDMSTDSVIATIPVGNDPTSIAIDSALHRAYVTNQFGTHDISVIDTRTNVVIKTIPFSLNPAQVAVDPVQHRAYIAANGGVGVIDTQTDAVIGRVDGSAGAGSIVVDSANHRAFFTAPDGVDVVDTIRNSVLSHISLAAFGVYFPAGIAFNSATNRIFVTASNNYLYQIDAATEQVVGVVSVLVDPKSMAVDLLTNRLYIAHPDINTLSEWDTTTNMLVGSIYSNFPVAVAADPRTHRLYVTSTFGGAVLTAHENAGVSPALAPAASTPEVDSVVLFAGGVFSLGSYALMRSRVLHR